MIWKGHEWKKFKKCYSKTISNLSFVYFWLIKNDKKTIFPDSTSLTVQLNKVTRIFTA